MAGAQQRLGHHVQRRHARHHPQELADITQRVPPQRQYLARLGGGHVHPTDADMPRRGQIVAIEHPHQRGFPRARRADQPHTFARRHIERGPLHHRNDGATLIVQGERLGQVFNLDH